MTTGDLLLLAAGFLFLLTLGGLWADAWLDTPAHQDARRRNGRDMARRMR